MVKEFVTYICNVEGLGYTLQTVHGHSERLRNFRLKKEPKGLE